MTDIRNIVKLKMWWLMLSAARNSLQLVKCVKSNVIKCLMVLGPPLIFLSIKYCNFNCNKYFITFTIQRNLKMEVYLLILLLQFCSVLITLFINYQWWEEMLQSLFNQHFQTAVKKMCMFCKVLKTFSLVQSGILLVI